MCSGSSAVVGLQSDKSRRSGHCSIQGTVRAATIWATLSTSGMRSLHLPLEPGRLTVASDGDTAGREAAHALAERAYAAGWAVSLLPAPEPIPFTPEGPQPLVREIAPGAAYPVAHLGPLRTLPLAPDARALLVGFSDAIEKAQAPGGDLAHVTGYASKAAEQAARIAGVQALWCDLDAPAVTSRDMGNGIALAQFYLGEAVRLADAATISQEIDRAEALRQWLLESWPHPEIMVRDVVRLGPNSLRESPKARAALGILERHGWLAPLDAGTVVRGAARAEAWRIVRGGGDVV